MTAILFQPHDFMAKYVLHIVDGDSRGEKLPLPEDRAFRIGRKKSNDLPIQGDEKVSGQHCELVLEGGMLILRDLGSTNGTRVDGKRIQEIPISNGDTFQVGQTSIRLVDEEAAAVAPPPDEMGLRIDAEALRRSSRRSPVALIALVLILGLGGAGWWFFLRPDAPRRKGSSKKVATVAGNLLPEALAHMEGDVAEWVGLASGGSFLRSGGARSGKSALRADLGGTSEAGEDGEQQSNGPLFAVAISNKTWSVPAGAAFEAKAWFRTVGEVRVALRVCFVGKAPPVDPDADLEDPEEVGPQRFERRVHMVAGTQIAKLPGAGYESLSCQVAAPDGAEEVTIALVAALPPGRTSEEARVFVDDVSLVKSSADGAKQSLQVKSRSVFAPDSAGSSVRISDGAVHPLLAVSVLPAAGSDPALEALATVLPLPASDLHGRLQLEAHDKGVKLVGGGGGRVVLHIGEDVLDGGSFKVRRRASADAEPAFETFGPEQTIDGATGIYWGYGGDMLHRILAIPSKPCRVEIDDEQGGKRFVIDNPGELDLQLVLDGEQLETMKLLREADAAFQGGDRGKALKLYGQILRNNPFEQRAVTRATLQRGTMLTKAGETLQELRRDFDEAQAFQYAGLYRALLGRLSELAALESEFGPEIATFRQQVNTQLSEVLKKKGEVRGKRLVEVAGALKEFEQVRLQKLICKFVIDQFAGTEAAVEAKKLLGN